MHKGTGGKGGGGRVNTGADGLVTLRTIHVF